MFIQFKICCCVQNFIEIDDLSLKYGDITILKNGSRQPSAILNFGNFHF